MKKKGLIIASLLVLVMSVFFIGCPPPEEELTGVALVKDTLSKWGYKGTFVSPASGTFDVCETTKDALAITWKGVEKSDFASFKTQWQAAAAREVSPDDMSSFASISLTDDIAVYTFYTTAGGTEEDEDTGKTITIAPKSIVFFASHSTGGEAVTPTGN